MRILIIRPGAIGDALLAFHILKILKAEHAHITFVSNADVLPLAQAFGLAEEIFDYAASAWSQLFSTEGIRTPAMQDMLKQTDLAICWLRDPDRVVAQNLLKIGVQRVIVAPGRPPEGEQVHIVNYLATTIGLQIGESDESSIKVRRDEGGRDGLGGPLWPVPVAIHPGSGSPHKCWPVHNFTVIIEHLTQCNIPVLLLAGPADVERVQNMQEHLSSQLASGMLKVLENLPLLEVAEHLQQCKGYLGNDSGITHLAAMLGVPTLVLFGPTDPLIWRPVGPSVRVIQHNPLEQLPIDVVIDGMKSFYMSENFENYRTSGM